MAPKLNPKDKPLTEVELEMMNIVWRVGPCSVHQVMEALPKSRALAYTSVSTMLRILEQKKFLKSTKDGRGHLYQATIAKDDYETTALGQMVQKLFEGEPSLLVRRLVASNALSDADVKEIQKIIQQRQK